MIWLVAEGCSVALFVDFFAAAFEATSISLFLVFYVPLLFLLLVIKELSPS